MNRARWHAHHCCPRRHIFHHRRTGTDHRARANRNPWANDGPRTNQGTRAYPNATRQHRARADMRGFFQHAIMFHNRAGIDQRECANPGIGANHRAGQHRHAIGKLHACADNGRGMNERRQRETRGTEPPCWATS